MNWRRATIVFLASFLGAGAAVILWTPKAVVNLIMVSLLVLGALIGVLIIRLGHKAARPALAYTAAVGTWLALLWFLPQIICPDTMRSIGALPARAACPAGCTQSCHCSDYKLRPCGGWSGFLGKNISCSAAGVDQDGHSCQGCCFDYVCTCNCPQPQNKAPSISGVISCGTNGAGGWCVAAAQLVMSASDPDGDPVTISGSIKGTPFTCPAGGACTRQLPEGSGDATFGASDGSLSSGNSSLNFKYDPTPPTANVSSAGSIGSNGWYTSVVAVSATGADATSGVASAEISVDGGPWNASATLPEGIYSVQARVTDVAGNTTITQPITVSVDMTAPTLSLTSDGTAGNDDWYVSPVRVSITVSDTTSGVASTEYRVDGGVWKSGASVDLNDGVHTIDSRVTDVAGNFTTATSTAKVDTGGPSLDLTANGTAGSAGWYVSPVAVSITATDNTSGMASTEYRIDGGNWQSGMSADLADGVHTVEARSADAAGNVTTRTQTVSVDTVAPVLTLATSGTSGNAGWYTSKTDLSLAATDVTSGVSAVEYNVDGTGWQSGMSVDLVDGVHVAVLRATDAAGNVTTDSVTIKVDSVRPQSAFVTPVEGSANIVVRGVLNLKGESSDDTSGVAGAQISLDGGSTWQLLTLDGAGEWTYSWDTSSLPNGTYVVLVHASDVAGNLDSTARVTVILDNHPPSISLTEWWWIWDAGKLKTSPNVIPIGKTTITISDPWGNWQSIKWTYDGQDAPEMIRWDRRLATEHLAPSGDYKVAAHVCDIYGLCASDKGTIKIPFITLPIPTLTPAPTLRPTQTGRQQPTSTAGFRIVGNQAESPLAASPAPKPLPEAPMPTLSKVVLWPAIGLMGLFMAIASASLSDPRPHALKRLGRTVDGLVGNGRLPRKL